MKNLFIIILLLAGLNVTARNFYISSSGGNDGNLALAPASAWRTFAKMNASWASVSPGDSILLKRGDTFYGSLVVAKSGSSGLPIVIGAYGTGAKPIISGFFTPTAWVAIGGGVYEVPAPAKNSLNMVTVNDEPQAVGRYPNIDAPNGGYMTYTGYSGNTTLTSPELLGFNWTNAEVVAKKEGYIVERNVITAQVNSTITYRRGIASINPRSNGNPLAQTPPDVGFGFFIQRDPRTLDKFGEWFFDTTTRKIKMYFGGLAPSSYTVKVSVLDTLINIGTRQYIHVTDLDLQGANLAAIYFADAGNLVIKNNNAKNTGAIALFGWASPNILVQDNTVKNSMCSSIDIVGRHVGNVNIIGNIFSRAGYIVGMGSFYDDGDAKNMYITVSSGSIIRRNRVDTSGYSGIQFQGNNVTVDSNYVDYFCFIKDDGGGIYTFSGTQTGRIIQHNIVLNGIGSGGAGTGNRHPPHCEGIYSDGGARGITVRWNSVAHISNRGIYFNDPKDVLAEYNNVYDAMHWSANKHYNDSIYNFVFRYNAFFASTYLLAGNNQTYFNSGINAPTRPTATTLQSAMQQLGIINYNYYQFVAVNTGPFLWYSTPTVGGNYTFSSRTTLANWTAFTGHDVNSKLFSSVTIPTDLFRYATDVADTISFSGFKYIEPDGTVHSNSVIIPPFRSKILMYNGTTAVPNVPPTVTITGGTQTITLPTSSTSVIAVGVDGDGTINAYLWTLISGPTIPTFGSATSATTTVNNLTTAGEYILQARVTDDDGATGTATVKITVNPAVPPPNLPPNAVAGADSTVTLPYDSTTLIGTGSTDSDGTITYLWTKFSGPATGTIVTPAGSTTKVRGLVQGTYQFLLTVTDDDGATSTDMVQIIVNSAANQSPIADAGTPQIIALPLDSAQLTGTGTDFDGSIVTYYWLKTAGPVGTGIITSINSASTMVTGLVAGNYTFRLTVTDNQGATSFSTVNIDVLPVVAPPPPPGTKKIRGWKKQQ